MIDFTAERQRHLRFVARSDVLARLDDWIDLPGETGWVVVTGGPGMGKSAILSAWLARREAAGAVIPHHFVRRQVADWDQPEVIAKSLAAQIEAAFPALCDAEATPERRLLELLGRVSKSLGSSRRLVIAVDGLDETRAAPGENPLPRFLPHVALPGIRFLCATRPTYPHLNWIEARCPVRRVDLDDRRWASSNEAVVRGFWSAVAAEYAPALPGETIRVAIARAEGNVLHAVMLHDALRAVPAEARRADRIPRGLRELIGETWDRAASHASVRVGLGLLCAAQEGLSLDVLSELAGWSYDDKQWFIRDARHLLLEEPASWAGVEAYRPRHDWVRELIVERLGTATVREHHRTLSRILATWPSARDGATRRYALHYALTHRVEAGDGAAAWRLAADTAFLEAKCRELGVHETEADLTRMTERCRASDDGEHARRFGDLARALTRESHWIRAAPEATAAVLWNRLHRSRWSAAGADAQLRIAPEAEFLRVRHAATRENPALIRDLPGHTGTVSSCALAADGRRVVSASGDGTLKVWDLESGRVLATLHGHNGGLSACAVTRNGRIVSASDDHTLMVWDLESGRALATLEGHVRGVNGCAVTVDGRRAVSASYDKTLKVWDLERGFALATLTGHTDGVSACAVTADGRRVVSASDDGTLKLWDLESGVALATLHGHTGGVSGCALTADGRRVVSASDDKTLRLWDLASGRVLAIIETHSRRMRGCALTTDGRRVISVSGSGKLTVWDLESRRAIATLEGHAGGVNGCAVTADGRRVVSASDDRTLKIWDLEISRTLATPEGHTNRVRGLAVLADGRRVVSASDDGTLKVWDLTSGRALATVTCQATWRARGCTVTADGRHAISPSLTWTLEIWDLETRQTLGVLEGHTAAIGGCVVTADRRRAVSASDDATLKVWDLESQRALVTLTGHGDRVLGCTVTADGRRAISASADRTLKVWDLESGRALATLRGHSGGVLACALTVDGQHVVSASDDETLKVWDLESGRALATLEGHTGGVLSCTVTASRRVVSASFDKTLKVWDLDRHACLFTHRGDAAYTAVVATADTIIAGDLAGGVWLIDWPRSQVRTATPNLH